MEKIKAQCNSIKKLAYKEIKIWNYKEVLKNHDELESVNESKNKLNLVPEEFNNPEKQYIKVE